MAIVILVIAAFGQTDQVVPPISQSQNTLPSKPVASPPNGSGPPSRIEDTPVIAPSGSNEAFSYAPSSVYEGVSVVYPSDGTEGLLVSTEFLNLSLQASNSSAETLKDAQMFEQLTNRVAEQFASQFYPDASQGTADVPETVLEGANRNVVIEQDQLAGPYARVTITDKGGKVLSQGSVSARMIQQILANPHQDAEAKINALLKTDFYLPEEARQDFNNLSAGELLSIVAEKPELQKQDFLKMTRVFAEEKARKEAKNHEADATTGSWTASDRTMEARSKQRFANAAAPSRPASPNDANVFQTGSQHPKPRAGWTTGEFLALILGSAALTIFLLGFIKIRPR